MIYWHQIKKADECNNNLDDGISRLVRNANLAKIRENQNNYYAVVVFYVY